MQTLPEDRFEYPNQINHIGRLLKIDSLDIIVHDNDSTSVRSGLSSQLDIWSVRRLLDGTFKMLKTLLNSC